MKGSPSKYKTSSISCKGISKIPSYDALFAKIIVLTKTSNSLKSFNQDGRINCILKMVLF